MVSWTKGEEEEERRGRGTKSRPGWELLRRDRKTGEKEEGRSGQVQKQSRPKACTLCRCVLGVDCMAWYGRDGMAVAVEPPKAGYTVPRRAYSLTGFSSIVDFAHKKRPAARRCPDLCPSSPLIGKGSTRCEPSDRRHLNVR